GIKMSSNYISMEEIPLEDDERDSIEYKILMAYAQRRLSVSKYRKLLRNEAEVQKSSSLIRRTVNVDYQWDNDGPSQRRVLRGGGIHHSKEQPETKYWPGHCVAVLQGPAEQKQGRLMPQSGFVPQGKSQHQTSEAADVNHIADKLAQVVTSKSQESPSDVSFKAKYEGFMSQKQDRSDYYNQGPHKEHDTEKIIQTIVSLLRQAGDKLEEKMEKDRILRQTFEDMLSYDFVERITDLYLENVSADSRNKPEGQVQCTKVAFTMEAITRLSAVDNHPMNLVLGFGLKYLREHFKPWIQDQGGWEKALTSLDQEEVE
ncbi:B2L14 protein, partial [Todus mexicanus]|nr:B2L14 protein [Todus mexicanus]